MKKTGKLGNQGFSLIELIVVIAICAVIVGAFVMGYSVIYNKEVEQCAKKMQSLLESNRTSSMGKQSASIRFYVAGGKVMAEKVIEGTSTIIEVGSSNVKVQSVVTKYDSGTTTPTTSALDGTGIKVEFDRASGSLKQYATNQYVTEFIVTNTDGSKTLHVKIDKLTGRVTVE